MFPAAAPTPHSSRLSPPPPPLFFLPPKCCSSSQDFYFSRAEAKCTACPEVGSFFAIGVVVLLVLALLYAGIIRAAAKQSRLARRMERLLAHVLKLGFVSKGKQAGLAMWYGRGGLSNRRVMCLGVRCAMRV